MKTDRIGALLTEVNSMLDVIRNKVTQDVRHVTSEYVCEILGIVDDHGQRIEEMLIEVEQDVMRLERLITNKKDFYETRLEEVKVEDPEVASMGTGAERLNRAKYKLRDLSKEIKDLEQELRETERLGKILIQRNKGLDRTRSSVNRQNEATIQSAKYLNLNYRATSEAFVDEGIEELKENSDFE
jgi:hypothetical protein